MNGFGTAAGAGACAGSEEEEAEGAAETGWFAEATGAGLLIETEDDLACEGRPSVMM